MTDPNPQPSVYRIEPYLPHVGNRSEPFEKCGTVFLRSADKLDCALFDPSSGVTGGSWHVDLYVDGALDSQGFVHDFSALKKLARSLLKSSLDHALVIPAGSSAVHFAKTPQGERWTMEAMIHEANQESRKTYWEYVCPKGAAYPVRSVALKPSVMEQELARLLRHRLPDSIQSIRVRLREETFGATEASYRYTHGISSYEGQCQRLFHGHRSRVEVFVGRERRPDYEQYVARQMFGPWVHLAAPSQVLSGTYHLGQRGDANQYITLGYQGSQGRYEATLPADRVLVVDQETSIECVARQVAMTLRDREDCGDQPVRVVCYEGIDKGAVADL